MSDAPRRFHHWTWLRRITAGAFLALLVLGGFDFFSWFRGSTSAATLIDIVPLVDPLAAIEVVLASRDVHWKMLLGSGILLAAAVLFGPVFCGWVCPLGLVLDVNQWARRTVMRLVGPGGKPPASVRVPGWIKYALLGALIGVAVVARLPVFQVISPINILARALAFIAGPALLLVIVIVLVEHRWPRLWCRALCPLGALYGVVGRLGLFRARIDPKRGACGPCRQCTRTCPMGIKPMEEFVIADRAWIDHPDCTRCGGCADVCPNDWLTLGLRSIEADDKD